jgi:hypothetical protein
MLLRLVTCGAHVNGTLAHGMNGTREGDAAKAALAIDAALAGISPLHTPRL